MSVYTFAYLKNRVYRGVLRDDLADDYGTFVNDALREVQNLRSWVCMKDRVTLAVPTGSGREVVTLPADFKELQKRPAVHYVTDEGGLVPAEVVTEEQQAFRVWAFGGTPIATWPPRVFFEKRATSAVLGVLEPMSQPFNLEVKYYKYLPDLASDTDASPLAAAYPMMVIAKAKALAFSSINDAAAVGFEQEFDKKFLEAVRQDAYSEVRGLTTRM